MLEKFLDYVYTGEVEVTVTFCSLVVLCFCILCIFVFGICVLKLEKLLDYVYIGEVEVTVSFFCIVVFLLRVVKEC